MSIHLKTVDGRYIAQPISHPATDEQVDKAIEKYLDKNGGTAKYDTTDIRKQIYGEEVSDLPALQWIVGQMDSKTGSLTIDTALMRIRCQKVVTKVNTVITFTNTSKYYHRVFVYDSHGVYLPEESDTDAWHTESTFMVAGDRMFCILVREQYYKVWNNDLIAAFEKNVKVTQNPVIGLIKTSNELSDTVEQIPDMQTEIDKNKNSIDGLRSAINSMDTKTNVLLNYDSNFFGELENGEILWSTGLNANDGLSVCVRSTEYKKISSDGKTFVADIPSTARHSYYSYTRNEETGEYTWVKASEWYSSSAAFTPEKGYYYRCLIYDDNGISPDECTISLCDSKITKLLDAVADQYKKDDSEDLLSVDLTSEENTELQTTIATIKNRSDSNTALIAFHTDLHIICSNDDEYLQQNSTKIQKYLSRYNTVGKECKVDLLVFGGDYLDNSSRTTKEVASESLAFLGSLMKKTRSSAPRFVIKGNHDDNTMYEDVKNGVVNDEERFAMMTNLDEDKTKRDADNIQKTYGYYDIPNKKIRVFMLNTADIPQVLDEKNNTLNYKGQHDTGFSQEQLQFVADHLRFDEAGWQVILFSHHPISNDYFTYEFGNNQRAGVTPNRGGDSMVEILDAFKAQTSGRSVCSTKDFESDVTYDFTNNKSNTIIANVHGHIHTNGVNSFGDNITALSARAVYGHPTYTSDGPNDAASYLVIDRKARKLYCVTDGYGPDLEISY